MALSDQPLKVLVTGAYGLIGNVTYALLARQPARFEPYAMVRRVHRSDRLSTASMYRIPDQRLRIADLRDADAVREALQGMDVAVHLAGDPDGRSGWRSVVENNIDGSYNIFEASREAGVARVVYASSNQVVFGYWAIEPYASHFAAGPRGSLDVPIPPIRHDQELLPPNLYACSKILGESFASMYANRHGLSAISLRIGWVRDDDVVSFPSLFCSRRDVAQAIERAITAPETVRHAVCFVHSDNHPNFVDIEHTRAVLGYEPQDRGEDNLPPDA